MGPICVKKILIYKQKDNEGTLDGGATWNPLHTYTCASRWPQAYTSLSGQTQQELDALIVVVFVFCFFYRFSSNIYCVTLSNR